MQNNRHSGDIGGDGETQGGTATPIGYQTNPMVRGPGGYRFADYLRMGVPLTLLTGLLTVLIVPWVWPF